MPKVEISPGPSLPTTFEARIAQPQTPTPSVMPPVALVEIETAAQLIPGPRGALWYTGTGAPTSIVGQQDGDMYLDNATDHVWQLQSSVWVDTGTTIHGSPDTPADILAKLLSVDGAGSGLDADLLDGHDTPYFATQVALDAETTARVSGDNTLQTNITSEANTRASADTTLQGNINTEVTNRTNADTALQSQITAHTSDIAGKVAKAGDTMTGNLTIAPASGIALETIKAVAQNALLILDKGIGNFYSYILGQRNGETRWLLALGDSTVDADAGANTGSDFLVQAYDDAGANPKAALRGLRASGLMTVFGDPTAPLGIATKGYVDNKPAGAVISDTPPSSPSPGQTWWESDTGNFYIWYDDGAGAAQWVQVNMLTPAGPPVRQTFSPGAGSSSLVIPVPTGAKHCKIGGRFYGATVNLSPVIRISLDGSTFLSGASDYTYGGTALYNGSSATTPTKIAAVAATYWPLGGYTDRITEAMFVDVDLVLKKTAGNVFCYRSRMWSYHSAATAGFQELLYAGYTGGSTLLNATEIKALQLTVSGGSFAGSPDSVLTVDWTY